MKWLLSIVVLTLSFTGMPMADSRLPADDAQLWTVSEQLTAGAAPMSGH